VAQVDVGDQLLLELVEIPTLPPRQPVTAGP
jgi:hypothetical protein